MVGGKVGSSWLGSVPSGSATALVFTPDSSVDIARVDVFEVISLAVDSTFFVWTV